MNRIDEIVVFHALDEANIASIACVQLNELERREDLYDDFCLSPFHPRELEARLKHLLWRSGKGGTADARTNDCLTCHY